MPVRIRISRGGIRTGETGVEDLSPRQKEILGLISSGRSNKEIAEMLGLSVGTVKQHIAILFRKLEVNSRTKAIIKGVQVEIADKANLEAKAARAQRLPLPWPQELAYETRPVSLLRLEIEPSSVIGVKGAQEIDQLYRDLYDLCRRIAHALEGQVEERWSGGCEIWFGLGVVHLDDAQRSVQAAQWARQLWGDQRPELMAAVATSPIIIASYDDSEGEFWTERAVEAGEPLLAPCQDQAAQLIALSKAGQIQVCELTRQLLPQAFKTRLLQRDPGQTNKFQGNGPVNVSRAIVKAFDRLRIGQGSLVQTGASDQLDEIIQFAGQRNIGLTHLRLPNLEDRFESRLLEQMLLSGLKIADLDYDIDWSGLFVQLMENNCRVLVLEGRLPLPIQKKLNAIMSVAEPLGLLVICAQANSTEPDDKFGPLWLTSTRGYMAELDRLPISSRLLARWIFACGGKLALADIADLTPETSARIAFHWLCLSEANLVRPQIEQRNVLSIASDAAYLALSATMVGPVSVPPPSENVKVRSSGQI